MTSTQQPSDIHKWAGKEGEFKRQTSSFRNWVSSDPGAQYTAESGRYHLYVSYACPWAHRTLIARAIKGLEDVISVSVVHFLLSAEGWRFPNEEGKEQVASPGATPDTVNGAHFLKDLYLKADPDYTGRFTVPVLWDKKTSTIVNNESAEIMRMLNSTFDQYSSRPGVTLYPEDLRAEIDGVNEWIYNDINNGVYKAGFATAQEAYEKACHQLFVSLDRVEEMLSKPGVRFLVGNRFTEADVRLFTTILRFDPVYHGHFKCNLRTITSSYPALLRWLRTVYQLHSGISGSVNMFHIKHHYYMSHIQVNPTQIVPLYDGPDLTVRVESVDPKSVPFPLGQ
ncbi:S-glutathionyl-(chloro)hydroquinone reductase [Sorochytrium milnesiophthora]